LAQDTLDPSPLKVLNERYEFLLGQYASNQAAILSAESLSDEPYFNSLEDIDVELGLRLDEIESQIVNSECSNLSDSVEYLRIVLDILARRESLSEHILVQSMKRCLTSLN